MQSLGISFKAIWDVVISMRLMSYNAITGNERNRYQRNCEETSVKASCASNCPFTVS